MAEVMMSNSCVFSSSSPIHHHQGLSTVSIKSASRIRPFSIRSSSSSLSSQSNSNFHGRRFLSQGADANYRSLSSINAQMITGIIGKAQKWWEKGLRPNMIEVQGAHDLVGSLLTAGDRLVIVNFFSPGCGGCKALHPKICQFAEMNPDVQFLHVNYEEHKSMCYSLNVHVLPFFRFYRGAHGRLCSFSCTNATIKKFRDALGKHSPDRCSLGPPKGLEEKELLALAANKDLSFDYTPKPEITIPVPAQEEILPETIPVLASHPERDHPLPLPHRLPSTTNSNVAEVKTWVTSGR